MTRLVPVPVLCLYASMLPVLAACTEVSANPAEGVGGAAGANANPAPKDPTAAAGAAGAAETGAPGGTSAADALTLGPAWAPTTPAAQRCHRSAGPILQPQSVEDLSTRLVRRWRLCNSPSFLGSEDVTGIEFTAEGQAYELRCEDGSLTRSGPMDWEILWSETPEAGIQYQLNVGGQPTHPRISDDPPMMNIMNMGVYESYYVPATEGDTSCDPNELVPPPLPPPTFELDPDVAAICETERGPAATIETTEDVTSRLVGRWMQCSDPSPWGTEDEVGLQIEPDGRWYKLYRRATTGELYGPGGFEGGGTWEVLDSTLQVNLYRNDGTSISFAPAFVDEPPTLRIDNNGVIQVDYVRVQE